MVETREILMRTPGATPNEQALVPLAGVKDFYARDTDPGAVGAGSVWKDTADDPGAWWERNADDDGWEADFAPNVSAAGNAPANAVSTANAADGDATSGSIATTSGTGDASATSEAGATGGGSADVTAQATAVGAGGANADATANAADGIASASNSASASGTGGAYATNAANADTGAAVVGSLASRQGISAGFDAKVDVTGVPMLGFNGAGYVPRPQLPATGSLTLQDFADVLVALGLVTQAP